MFEFKKMKAGKYEVYYEGRKVGEVVRDGWRWIAYKPDDLYPANYDGRTRQEACEIAFLPKKVREKLGRGY